MARHQDFKSEVHDGVMCVQMQRIQIQRAHMRSSASAGHADCLAAIINHINCNFLACATTDV